jgi:hypothetical protein
MELPISARHARATSPHKMNQQEWERDIINRQRNTVFPDTVLNEGRFYRNVVSSSRPTLAHRIGIFLISAVLILGGCISLALAISALIGAKTGSDRLLALLSLLPSTGLLAFGIVLCVKGLIPPKPQPRRRRGGYRSSNP